MKAAAAIWIGRPMRDAVSSGQFGPVQVPVFQILGGVAACVAVVTLVYGLAVHRATRPSVAEVFRKAL